VGQEFDLPRNERWDRPIDSHGTHVSGIILAQGGNNEGIVGVIPNNQNMCVLVARAFGDNAVIGARTSATSLAVEWCADNGARVINMSLGGGSYSETGRALMQRIAAEGILVIAAAGNEGNSTLKYPASYDDVMSVAAVDISLQRASFSQTNNQVDIAAPGVDINSTIPAFKVFKNGDSVNNRGYDAMFLGYSPLVNVPIEGNLIDCFKAYITCVGAEGKVCLIERGDNTFQNKALNCQNGGGIAAIVYDNDRNTGIIGGNLGTAGAVNIPVVEIERVNALELRIASSVLIDPGVPRYRTVEGTSAAAPFVSGVAARIWAARPKCTNMQVREALEGSALDLGSTGKDNQYGHGLVQAKEAYLYLLSLPAPCGDRAELVRLTATQAPATAPVLSPTLIRKSVSKTDKGNFIISDNSRNRGSGRARALKGSGPVGMGQHLS
jgi:serine protease